MSNPVDPQTGDPETPDPPDEHEAPVEAMEPVDSGGIVVEVEAPGDDGGEAEVEIEAEPGAEGAEGAEGEEAEAEPEPEPPDPVAELEAKLAESDRIARENYNRLVRTAADLDNFRKRTRRDIADAEYKGKAIVLREILPVVDNLERAVAAAGDAAEVKSIREGVELVLRQFTQTLEKLQVVKVEAHGKPFDPNVHEAVGQAPTAEHPPGTVVEVLQQGYALGDRLLRAALCIVATAPPEPAPETEAAAEAATEAETETEAETADAAPDADAAPAPAPDADPDDSEE